MNGTNWARYDAPGPNQMPGQEPMERAYPPSPAPQEQKKNPIVEKLESPAFQHWLRRRHYTNRLMLLVLAIMISLVTIGFGYTILGVFLFTVAWGVGGWFDGNPTVYRILQRFL